ncbi:MAG: acyltransferase [Saccharofermentans sp.]|nr:acyltransferase [Saccharofermentans sp.]
MSDKKEKEIKDEEVLEQEDVVDETTSEDVEVEEAVAEDTEADTEAQSSAEESIIIEQPNRIDYLGNVRALAALAIVILHSCLIAVQTHLPSEMNHMVASSIRNLMMWAVPCFVMVTGALLLNPEKVISYKKLFGKYIARILYTLFAFTAIYILADYLMEEIEPGTSLLKLYVGNLVFDSGWIHMWYLYMVLALYLLMPVYKAVASKLSDSDFKYVLAVLFVFQSVLTTVTVFTGKQTAFFIGTYTIFPFYLLMGYAISSSKVKFNKVLSIIGLIAGALISVGLTILSVQTKSTTLGSFLGNYSSVVIVVLAVSIFSLAAQANGKSNKLLKLMDECSFGIYLVHMILIKWFYTYLGFNPFSHGKIFGVIVSSVLVYIASLGIVFVIRLIPGVKKLL